MNSLTIRDGHAAMNRDEMQYEMPSGSLDIIAPDGRALFCITLNEDFSISISAGAVNKIADVLFDDQLIVRPIACNRITIIKPPYKP